MEQHLPTFQHDWTEQEVLDRRLNQIKLQAEGKSQILYVVITGTGRVIGSTGYTFIGSTGYTFIDNEARLGKTAPRGVDSV